jgi:GxxExxY protein
VLHDRELTERIIGAALRVHSSLGPGLLESTYQACLHYEMQRAGLVFAHHVKLPVVYEQVRLDAGYRLDFLVEQRVIVEIKSVEKLLAQHTGQLLTYLKLSGLHVGLLINFNVKLLASGLRRVVLGNPLLNPRRRFT